MQRSSIEVLEAAASYDLVTLDDVKAYLQITSTTDDVRLRTLIAFASRVIADLCDRVLGQERVTETINIDVTSDLADISFSSDYSVLLARYPLVSVEGVTVDGSAVDDYLLDVESGVLHGTLGGEVIVTYTGGYILPDYAPGPLSMACIDLIRQTYYYGNRDPMIQSITDNASGSIRFFPPPGVGTRGSSVGGQSRATALSPTATALILPYRRVALA